MQQLKMSLPEKVSTNKIYAGLHWNKRRELADLYHLAVLVEARKQGLGAAKDYPVTVSYHFGLKRLLDVSNCSFMVKLLEDGLVHAKILAGDTPEYVKEIRMSVEKTKEDLVTITIQHD
jgi:hypothetical protein